MRSAASAWSWRKKTIAKSGCVTGSSAIDRLYSFAFYNHKKQWRMYVSIYSLAMLYIGINLCILGRNSNNILYEAVAFTIISSVACPLLYCLLSARGRLPFSQARPPYV